LQFSIYNLYDVDDRRPEEFQMISATDDLASWKNFKLPMATSHPIHFWFG